MEVKQYFIIENNVVVNSVMWDGNVNTWQPPIDSIAVISETTPAMLWNPVLVDNIITDWILKESIGIGDIGFTWNDSVLTTNQPKPSVPTV